VVGIQKANESGCRFGRYYLLVLYIYLLFHCRGNKTHFGQLDLIGNNWASNTTNNIKRRRL